MSSVISCEPRVRRGLPRRLRKESCSNAPRMSRYDTEWDAGSLVAVRAGNKGFYFLKAF
jgi:hypothetical protein